MCILLHMCVSVCASVPMNVYVQINKRADTIAIDTQQPIKQMQTDAANTIRIFSNWSWSEWYDWTIFYQSVICCMCE